MPRSTREYLLRYADQADNDLDRALQKLKQMSDTYGETHTDYRDFVDLVATQLIMIQKQLSDFRHDHM